MNEITKKITSACAKLAPDAVRQVMFKPVSATSLMQENLPDIIWFVYGLITAGLTLLVGKPKSGKSFLALMLAIHIALGKDLWEGLRVRKSRVLYLAFEDSKRRIKARTLLLGYDNVDGLDFDFQLPDPDRRTVLVALRSYFEQHKDCKVVFIDTLQRIRPPSKAGAGMYESDSNFLAELHSLALEFDVAMICLHHVRKATSKDPFEMVSGSNGLMGVADCTMVVESSRGTGERTLHITGRDVADMSLAMTFDNGRWDLLGDAAQTRMSKERQQIVDVLKAAAASMSPKHIADALGKNRSNINKLLLRLQAEGHVQSKDGLYRIPNTKTTDTHIGSSAEAVTPVTDGTPVPPFTMVTAVTPFPVVTGDSLEALGGS